MIEKIARAMCVADGYSNPDAPFSGNALSGPRWEQYKTMAEAALDALETPTEGMLAEPHWDVEGLDGYMELIRAAKDGK